MDILINGETLNTVIDSDHLTTTELGYLLKVMGLLEPNSTRLQYSTKRDICSAIGVSINTGGGALRALESIGILYKEDGYMYLTEELVTGGDK